LQVRAQVNQSAASSRSNANVCGRAHHASCAVYMLYTLASILVRCTSLPCVNVSALCLTQCAHKLPVSWMHVEHSGLMAAAVAAASAEQEQQQQSRRVALFSSCSAASVMLCSPTHPPTHLREPPCHFTAGQQLQNRADCLFRHPPVARQVCAHQFVGGRGWADLGRQHPACQQGQ
jgi:hypothetical protein